MPIRLPRNLSPTLTRAFLVGFLALVAFVATSTLHAQESQPAQSSPIDALAAKMAGAIAHSKEKTVIVFDFVGPGDKQTVLGQTLTDEFAAALAQSSGKFGVEGRSKTRSVEDRIVISTDLKMAILAAQIEGAKSLVHGKLSLEGNNLTLIVDSYHVKSAERINGFQVVLPFKDEWKESSEKIVEGSELAKYAAGGSNGSSMPACIYCPRADYTDEAVHDKVQGEVILMTLIGPDGRARITSVTKALPDGLTAQAIHTILTWKFKPATGPHGMPATVSVPIEVQFSLGTR